MGTSSGLLCNGEFWVSVSGNIATIGINDRFINYYGGFREIKLPNVGDSIVWGDEVIRLSHYLHAPGTGMEAASPITGKVIEINKEASSFSGSDPTKDRWLYKISMDDPTQLDHLIDEDTYKPNNGER